MKPEQPEAPRPPPRCPFCGSRKAEVISLFGTQAITLQYRCRGCGSIYEAIKYAGEAGGAPAAADSPARRRGGAGRA